MQPLAALALALVLAATSVTMAVARGQARPVDRVVICTGHGMTTIALDAGGNPVSPVDICPDCTLSPLAATGGAAILPARPGGLGRPVFALPEARVLSRGPAAPRARGPPAPV